MARRKIQVDMFDAAPEVVEVSTANGEEAPVAPPSSPQEASAAPATTSPANPTPAASEAMQTPASMRDDQVPSAASDAGVPTVRSYVVTRDGRLNQNGGVVWLRAGKIVTDAAYSIPLLRQAGIQLSEV